MKLRTKNETKQVTVRIGIIFLLTIAEASSLLQSSRALCISQSNTAANQRSDFENFKREMMPQVGKNITVVGILRSAKLGWLVTFKGWGVYIHGVAQSGIPKMNDLNRFDGHTVQVTGTLQYFPEPAVPQSDRMVAVAPEHFYFDVAEVRVVSLTTPRTVKGQVLISPSLPSLRVMFNERFKYVGSQRFIL